MVFFWLIIVILLYPQAGLADMEQRMAGKSSLVSPFDHISIMSDKYLKKEESFKCRPVSKPQRDLIYTSIYSDSKQSGSTIDEAARKKYKKDISHLSRYERNISNMSDIYILTGRKNSVIANCVLDWLYVWAMDDAYLGEVNHQGEAVRKWGLAVLATSYAKIRKDKNLDKNKNKKVRHWLHNIAYTVKDDYSQHLNRRTRNNNHVYWAAWSVMITGTVLNDRELFDWSVGQYRKALTQIDSDGTLPLEISRKGKAYNYHVFAAGPLVMMAETGKLNNLNLYQEKGMALHKLVDRILIGLRTEFRYFARKTWIKQDLRGTLESHQWAWLEVYYARFPDYRARDWLKEKRPTIQRRLGGDLTASYGMPFYHIIIPEIR